MRDRQCWGNRFSTLAPPLVLTAAPPCDPSSCCTRPKPCRARTLPLSSVALLSIQFVENSLPQAGPKRAGSSRAPCVVARTHWGTPVRGRRTLLIHMPSKRRRASATAQHGGRFLSVTCCKCFEKITQNLTSANAGRGSRGSTKNTQWKSTNLSTAFVDNGPARGAHFD